MALPLFKDSSQPFQLLQLKWSSILNPLIAQPLSQALILPHLIIMTGSNIINHRLGRVLQGYLVILNQENATFYDDQENNQMPDLTLNLISSADTIISLMVF